MDIVSLDDRRALDLFLFHTDPEVVTEATAAGVDGFIVDWELRGKQRRQAGEGTQVNHDTLADLHRVRAATDGTVLCRLNGYGDWTAREVELAVDAGVDELLLPMVRESAEVDRTLEAISGRCGLGILIETNHGVRAAKQLASRPLTRVYIGLNDLRIDRGSDNLFTPLVDGTVDQVRAQVVGPDFGVAGLTVPGGGVPVPTGLLAADLIRLRADFTFLRRSFLADTAGRPLAPAVASMRDLLHGLSLRDVVQAQEDRDALVAAVVDATARPA